VALMRHMGSRRCTATEHEQTSAGADDLPVPVAEAIACYGKPEIFNTEQGSQFTSSEFTGLLHGYGTRPIRKLCHRTSFGLTRPHLVPDVRQ
jgi:hypothetical protein